MRGVFLKTVKMSRLLFFAHVTKVEFLKKIRTRKHFLTIKKRKFTFPENIIRKEGLENLKLSR